MGRGTNKEVLDVSGYTRKVLGRVQVPSRWSETGRETLGEVRDGTKDPREVRDGSGDSRKILGRVWRPSWWSETGRETFGEVSYGSGIHPEGLRRVGGPSGRSGTARLTNKEVRDGLGTLPGVRDGLGDSREIPGRVWRPSWWSETG